MGIFLATFLIFVIVISLMAIGVILSNKKIRGSCGGVEGCRLCFFKNSEECRRKRDEAGAESDPDPPCDAEETPRSGKLLSCALLAVAFMALNSSCAARRNYQQIETGEFSGNLQLHWIGPDKFLFVPDEEKPFEFTRANGEVIRPGVMYTDGGSVPRQFWSHPNLSPWGFAPAYIVHDWLFFVRKERLPGYENLTLEETADIFTEAVKTLMEEHRSIRRNPLLVEILRRAVSGDAAAEAWLGRRNWARNLPSPERIVNWGVESFKDLPVPPPE